MGRAPCCEKVGLNKGTWSEEEDAKLIAYVSKHGHQNWRALPKLAGLLRCGKSCRLRWFNYLRPDIKRGHFTEEEEETIIKLHSSLGNKWSKIASCLPGRTDNEIKNVWNTHLKKRVQQQPASDTCAGDEGPSDGGGERALLFEIPIESSIDDLLSVPSSEAPCASSLTSSSSSSKIDNVVDEGRQPSSAWLPDFPGLPELDQIWKSLEEFEVERDQMGGGGGGGGGGEGSTSEWLEYLEKELGLDEEAMRAAAAEGDPDSSYIQAQSSNFLRY